MGENGFHPMLNILMASKATINIIHCHMAPLCFTLSSGTLLVKAHRDKNLRTYAYTSQLDYIYTLW